MNTPTLRLRLTIAALLAAALSLCAQDTPRGHWTGSVEVPNQSLGMEVDLDKTATGWIGSVSIPLQNASGIPLEAISFEGGKVVFKIKGAPGGPTFTGTLSEGGKTLSGDFTQGPASFPFKFTRAGEPKVEVDKPSPAVAKEFLGTWEGTLEAGQSLRLTLTISNVAGSAKAVLVSLDQGGTEIQVSSIEQKGSKLNLTVKMIGGGYDAEINKDGTELNGTWSQGGGSLPLKMKKAAAKP